jgi:aminopeptidase YwaD
MSIDFHQSARRALDNTADWIDCYGGRLAGSDACRKMAERLKNELAVPCAEAHLETFSTHPAAFMNFHRISFSIYVISTFLLFLRQPFPAAVGFVGITVCGMLEFGFYKELFDPLYAQKTCANVWAKLEPLGEVRQQIILSGHHDSAQELTLLRHHQKLYAFKIILPDFFQLLGTVFAVYWAAYSWITGANPVSWQLTTVCISLGIWFFLPKFFLVSPQATPGAGDNLIASAMLLELAARLSSTPGKSALEHTRVLFVSFDAEESGLRGSRDFARRYASLLQSLPTWMFNMDSIYNLKELQFLVNDLNGYIPLSTEMVNECLTIAAEAGYPARRLKMVFGGGATDASELAKLGVKATTLIAMPTTLIRDGLVYHTMQDTVDAIEPPAVEACLCIAWNWLHWKDRQLAIS